MREAAIGVGSLGLLSIRQRGFDDFADDFAGPRFVRRNDKKAQLVCIRGANDAANGVCLQAVL